MGPFHLCIALGPLAVYLLLLGLINLSARPFLTTGVRDSAALSVAISGFVIAGPLDHFFPETAAVAMGGYLLPWLLLVVLYALVATLIIMLLRPRLVVYNTNVDELRPILAGVVEELDHHARWAGDSLMLPNLGVRLYIEAFAAMRNVELVSTGGRQSFAGWRQLELAMRRSLEDVRTAPNPRGISFVAFAVIVGVFIAFSMMRDQQAVAQALWEMLRL